MKNILYTILSILCWSCTSTNKEAITPAKPKTENEQQVISNPTYSANVKPILNFYSCFSCHSQSDANSKGGGIALEPFDNLLIYVKEGSFYGSMEHTGSWSPMPKGGAKTTDAELKTIKTWIDNGAKND